MNNRIYILRGAMASLFLLFALTSFAEINVVIIDTGFCSAISEFDATKSLGSYCSDASNDRLHGKRVLEKFLIELKPNLKSEVKLTGITVFDKDGLQKVSYWQNTINKLAEINPDIVISSVALPLQNKINPFPTYRYKTFVAAARKQRRIKKSTVFWPHEWKTNNYIIIGSFVGGNSDKRELYQTKTDYVFEYSSSIANGHAAAKALNLCSNELITLKKCLEKHSTKVNAKGLSKTF